MADLINQFKDNKKLNRRAFLDSLARISVLGAILFLVGFLFTKRKIDYSGTGECALNTDCGNCPGFDGCNLKEKKVINK
jgi:hypothetical protein